MNLFRFTIMKKLFTALLFLCVCISPALAKNANDSIRVLFIGNSYTYFNNLPNDVQKIAESQRLKLSYRASLKGGFSFERHLKDKETIAKIKEGNWDYVILQEQSEAPAKPTHMVAEDTYLYAHTLDSLVHAYSPKAHVVFYMTWGHKYGCQTPVPNYPLIDSYTGMQERLKTSYLEMTYANGAWCAPVGMAWQQVRRERPDYVLYTQDSTHPSPLGTYLAANVIFSAIHQKPYQTAYTKGLQAEQAEYIQQTAQNMVLNNLRLLNIAK